jgi:hypothetical protein
VKLGDERSTPRLLDRQEFNTSARTAQRRSTSRMKIQYVHEGVELTAIVESAECRISDIESRVWTEEEFREMFVPDNAAAARKAYQVYRRTYSPSPDSEAARFVELLRGGRIPELETEYKYWITPSGDRSFEVHFTRRAHHKKKIKKRKKNSLPRRKRKKRQGHSGAWLIYTPFETNRRRH